MMNYKCGDVVLADVEFAGKKNTGKRPALIISNSDYNKVHQDVIIAAITGGSGHLSGRAARLKKWKEAGLMFPSVVTVIIQTVHENMLGEKLGSLSEKDFRRVQECFKKAVLF